MSDEPMTNEKLAALIEGKFESLDRRVDDLYSMLQNMGDQTMPEMPNIDEALETIDGRLSRIEENLGIEEEEELPDEIRDAIASKQREWEANLEQVSRLKKEASEGRVLTPEERKLIEQVDNRVKHLEANYAKEREMRLIKEAKEREQREARIEYEMRRAKERAEREIEARRLKQEKQERFANSSAMEIVDRLGEPD